MKFKIHKSNLKNNSQLHLSFTIDLTDVGLFYVSTHYNQFWLRHKNFTPNRQKFLR